MKKNNIEDPEETYFIAIDNGLEGWSLQPYESLESIKIAILSGETFGGRFRILKNVNIVLSGGT